ncbi:MAG: cbb3-type cytochrome c oxidase N-terminal domain-containing protein [Bdellovibrionales bacterium]
MSDTNKNDPTPMDHAYDGIQEYDNPLPAWWLITFFLTIIFGFNYWIDAEFAGRQTQVQEAESEVAALRALSPTTAQPQESEDEYKQLAASGALAAQGKSVYVAKCAACHGAEGQGLIGPNLTDDHWLNGRGGFVDVAKVVRQGVLDKGMPAWETQVSADELKQVVVYVVSLAGTQPANPKPPQGEKVAR